MRDTAELRAGLAELAEPVTPSAGYEGLVRKRAGRLRARRRATAAVAAATCLAVLVALFRVVAIGTPPQLVMPPADGPFLGWPADDVVDTGLLREATEVWNRDGATGPYTEIRPLIATTEQRLHAVVILQGYDARRQPRLAFFTSDQTAADALVLRADRPAPDPAVTQVISLISPRLNGPAGVASDQEWDSYAIALAMPGVHQLRILTTTIDDQMFGDPGDDRRRFAVSGLLLASTAQNTVVDGYVKADRPFSPWTRVFSEPVDSGTDRDARPVVAEVVSRSGDQITVRFQDTAAAVRPGQLAVVRDGLAGRVSTVDRARGQAVLDLVTSADFTLPGWSNISNFTGTMRGTGGTLTMTGTAPDAEIYEGNRVMVHDPAQRDPVGMVTIGYAAATKPAGATSVTLTPVFDAATLREVSIMTPAP